MAVTEWDDYFIHQVVDTIDAVGTDEPSHMDRLIFCCHNTEGTLHLITGMGVYPNVNIMDGFLCMRHKNTQRNIRVSRHLKGDRTNMQVGPLSFKVLEPQKRWGISLDDNDYGIGCSLEFKARAVPYFYPFSQLPGFGGTDPATRNMAHYDQLGRYTGSITFEDQQINANGFLGTRDRSWGPRGRRLPGSPTGMDICLWIQVHFSSFSSCLMYIGRSGVEDNPGVILGDDGSVTPILGMRHRIELAPDRTYTKVELLLKDANGKERHLIAKPISPGCFMGPGAGYGGLHGLNRGPFHVEGERWDVSQPGGIDCPYGIHQERDVELQLDGERGVGLIESVFSRDPAWQYKPSF